MTREKKLLMWTVWIVSLVQMIGAALTPALNIIKTEVFTGYPLSKLQTVMMLTGLVSPFVALLSSEFIRRGLVTKKSVVLGGLFTLGATGLLALVLNTRLWHLGFLSVLTGVASGCYLSTVLSIMLDRFAPDERRAVTGLQSVFVNLGGFLISLLGGLLAAWRWYGGFLILLAGFPLGVLSIVALPKERRIRRRASDGPAGKARFDGAIFYYAAAIFVFMLLSAAVNANLAVHLAFSGFGDPALAGVITSVQMAGGVALGFLYPKLAGVMKDRLLCAAFLLLFACFTMLNVFSFSLVLMGAGVFLAGAGMSLIGPHCVVAVSHCVDERTSALATSLITGLAPGLGSFLSPIVFTNLTTAFYGESTNARYQFVAVIALLAAAAFAGLQIFRDKKAKKAGKVNEA